MAPSTSFPTLPGLLESLIRDQNPWWRDERQANLAPRRRWLFDTARRSLAQGLAPITVLRGPRQVGKSTLQDQIIDDLLESGVSVQRVLRVQFDDLRDVRALHEPILEIAQWYATSILGKTLNSALLDGNPIYFFFDEVQNLRDWAVQSKHLVDIHKGLRVLLTGSSALRIEAGRDSLAGRITTLEMGPLLLREVMQWRDNENISPLLTNGPGPMKELDFWKSLKQQGVREATKRHRSFQAFSERGSYPLAQSNPSATWEEVANALNETVVRRAIQHDLRVGDRGKRRDESLLEDVFRLTCRYAGQSPGMKSFAEELNATKSASIGIQRVRKYLEFLDATMLIRTIDPLEIRMKKRKGAAKLCLCDHALRAAWLQEVVPLAPDELAQKSNLTDLAGRIAESVAGYFFRSIIGLNVSHFPERPNEPEVDFVLTIGDSRIPVEIKYRRRIDGSDQKGLLSFLSNQQYNAGFGVLITLLDEAEVADERIIQMPLSTLLLAR
uniref:ATP-binding protein n=1 Tax=mine drainage metagenome TaxID=410659 RepID=E6PYI0_9ZZZZ